MRIVKLAICCSLLAVILADTIAADEASVPILRQPMSVRQTAFDYDNHLYFSPQETASDSPSDKPAADEPLPVETGCGAACDDSCGKSCDRSCGSCGDCCDLGDPCTLPQPCFLKSRGITVGGWFSAGIYGNTRAAPDNGPLGFNNVGDGFTMNQLWLYMEKATDTGGYGTDLGFRFDYVFGVDGPDTQSFGDQGWDYDWNSSRDYGSAIPQLYLEFAVNDLTIKFGHFYTIIGWEVVQAPDNFFYSHSYTQYYAEPFTHTGFLASYAVNDSVTAYGGWTTGWDTGFEDLNEASTFLGGLSFALSDAASLTWAVTAGDFGVGRNGRVDGAALADGDIYMNSFVLEYQVTDNLTYILQHDLGQNSDIPGGTTNWYGVNQYLQYAFNDCLAGGLRFEWFRDDNGARVTDDIGDFYEITAGVNYRPHANVILRPEIRFDWFDGQIVGTRPFGRTGQFTDQVSGGFDFIVTY